MTELYDYVDDRQDCENRSQRDQYACQRFDLPRRCCEILDRKAVEFDRVELSGVDRDAASAVVDVQRSRGVAKGAEIRRLFASGGL